MAEYGIPRSKHRGSTAGHIRALGGVMLLMMFGGMAFACSDDEPSEEVVAPAQVVEIDGSELPNLVLEPRAAERLAIEITETAEIEMETPDGDSETRLLVPYSAIIYDPDGRTWVYAALDQYTFAREEVAIDYVVDTIAVLAEGPEAGTKVVMVGAAELYGEETGVGK